MSKELSKKTQRAQDPELEIPEAEEHELAPDELESVAGGRVGDLTAKMWRRPRYLGVQLQQGRVVLD